MTVQGAATEVADENGVPAEFSLGQNYPNPFNPKTSFEFGVTSFGFVAVRVFDLLGREVAVLVSEEKGPGRYRVSWDAGNSPSGVYFYRVQAGERMVTRRMTLIR